MRARVCPYCGATFKVYHAYLKHVSECRKKYRKENLERLKNILQAMGQKQLEEFFTGDGKW